MQRITNPIPIPVAVNWVGVLSATQIQSSFLELCTSTQSLQQTQQAHAVATIGGLLPRGLSVCASLILRYAIFGDPSTPRILFERTLPYCRDAFLWNTLIRTVSISGVHDGFETYNRMVRNGVEPDDHTFPFVLKMCADFLEVRKGKEVHGMVFKVGFHSNIFVGNTLLLFYGGCRDLKSVGRVFDEMVERDIVSWNSMIGVASVNGCHKQALDVFQRMMRFGFMPNTASVVSVMPICAELQDGFVTREIHSYVMKVGLCDQVSIGNTLVDAYGKCGNLVALNQVFSEMVEKNEVSWNAVITSLAFRHNYRGALSMFRKMIYSGLKPNSVTLSSMIPVLVELELFIAGKEIHGFGLRTGMESDIFVANSLIDMYAKSGNSSKASVIFQNMKTRNVVSWNAMIANFAQNNLEPGAIELVRQMQARGEVPNSMTFTNLLPACARVGSLYLGKEIHARSIRFGLSFDLFLSNALTDMYVKCRSLYSARKVFDVSHRDEVSYNILIVGYSQTSNSLESLVLFSEMGKVGMKHDTVSFVGVLSASANLPAIRTGKEIHGYLIRKNVNSQLFIANSLLNFYTKCGRIDLAKRIFDCIHNKDVASWNAMILGYGMLGELDTAISFFEAMRECGVAYDSVSYIAVLSACSHGGLVGEGRRYFKEMHAFGVKPKHMHYACMVDLLGRAGFVDEAAELIKNLPIPPDASIWGALLGASRMHGNIELGCWAADHLIKLNLDHPGYFVLLSNLYAEAGRWEDADRVRELMKLREVKKSSGCSWVQRSENCMLL